jgi:hypothetical protein
MQVVCWSRRPWEESIEIVMIEKITCGTPVVAVCGRGVPELSIGGATGLVCDWPDDVAGAIERTRTVGRAIFSAGRFGSGYEQTDQEVARHAAASRMTMPQVVKAFELQRNPIGTGDRRTSP